MAGDWIKFDISTFDKPEVIAMADALSMPENHVVGCLLQVWAWFDQQTENGNARSVTKAYLDRRTGVTGFGDAMQKVGWLIEDNGGLIMPSFDTHNGKSAKKRALTARRVAKSKQKKGNAEVTPTALPKEEKSITPQTPQRGAFRPDGQKPKPRPRPRIGNTPESVGKAFLDHFGRPAPVGKGVDESREIFWKWWDKRERERTVSAVPG